MDQVVIMLEEVQYQPADPGYMLACGDRDIFDEEVTYTVSQLMADLKAPTQEDPEVPAHSLEVEEALKPVHIECWVSMMDAGMEGQDV